MDLARLAEGFFGRCFRCNKKDELLDYQRLNARDLTESLACGRCSKTIWHCVGAQALRCPYCEAVNGVPFHTAGYQQAVGLHPAAEVGLPPPAISGKRRALLCGCNYPGTSAQLRGCANDAARMYSLLRSQFGFADSEIRILTDDEPYGRDGPPTRAEILEGFRWLMAGVQPGDCLVFHFSGHGAQQEDPTYREEDGYDETVLPTDFQVSGHLVDDEAFDLICAPLPSGAKLVAIFDCCHSGGGLDLPFTLQSLSGKWTEDTNPYYCAGDVLLISGCDEDDCSADASGRYGEPAGAMTTALCDALQENPRQSCIELLSNVDNKLRVRGFDQVPQLSSSQQWDAFSRPFSFSDDIVSNTNPQLGRLMRKQKHPKRDISGPLSEMLSTVGTGLMLGHLMGLASSGGFGAIGEGFTDQAHDEALRAVSPEDTPGGLFPPDGQAGGTFSSFFGGGVLADEHPGDVYGAYEPEDAYGEAYGADNWGEYDDGDGGDD